MDVRSLNARCDRAPKVLLGETDRTLLKPCHTEQGVRRIFVGIREWNRLERGESLVSQPNNVVQSIRREHRLRCIVETDSGEVRIARLALGNRHSLHSTR